jgi:hypothetical protein
MDGQVVVVADASIGSDRAAHVPDSDSKRLRTSVWCTWEWYGYISVDTSQVRSEVAVQKRLRVPLGKKTNSRLPTPIPEIKVFSTKIVSFFALR